MNVSDPDARDAEGASFVAGIEHLRAGESVTLPIIKETARIGKRMVETGRVRVQTRTETSEQVGPVASHAVGRSRGRMGPVFRFC